MNHLVDAVVNANMGAIVSAPRTLAYRNHQKSMHAALMLWAWGVFLPSAVLLASLRTKHNVALGTTRLSFPPANS